MNIPLPDSIAHIVRRSEATMHASVNAETYVPGIAHVFTYIRRLSSNAVAESVFSSRYLIMIGE